ncbi:enoyl-CoA hydratase/isomerase family protein [Hydrogenophaga laconesensis]|uniref:Enoyl-CoA hydratase/carnithine racemase n=1 Tax=Hydrogenophaga laconesensis TaxID=1805971 RepID=A0ABU1VIY7_9BURK|nr:enoyl-CoA hydratase-related protein [Hydrogenophaga laconesensis]MDR7097456.1 enoyl-CoA hydratase/carnithine racemase [Hydrogenophaga laconesensis]
MERYAQYEHLKVEIADRIATLTLNRPESRNALNRKLIHELRSIWLDLAEDHDVNAVVLTGAGDYFSVGGDVKHMSDRPGGDFLAKGEIADPSASRRLLVNMLELDKPVVCAINGDAVGLAATVALLSDITVMADTARVGDPHVRVGLVAGDGGAVVWPLLLGISRAKEMLMRGLLIKGPEAERIGLVNHVVPRDQVLTLAQEIARELADGATWAIRWTKLSVNKILKDRMNLVYDASNALEKLTLKMEDHQEAARAFKEKRKPAFKGY